MSVGLSVCLRQTKTPTSGGPGDLWSKIAFLIFVWEDTIFQKRGGIFFFSLNIVKMRGFEPPPTNIKFRKLWRPLVEDRVPSIGLG